jgi:hypothetical protein
MGMGEGGGGVERGLVFVCVVGGGGHARGSGQVGGKQHMQEGGGVGNEQQLRLMGMYVTEQSGIHCDCSGVVGVDSLCAAAALHCLMPGAGWCCEF